MISRRQLLLLAPFCALAPAATRADDRKSAEKARKKRAQQEALEALKRGEILPLTKILAIALEQVPGDVIEVEFKGGPVYEIKVLAATGRIREVKLDARSGAVLKIEDD